MRLDKFLKVSRIIKRRTVANNVADKGKILLNGLPSKPGKQVKVGDIITVCGNGGETSFKIIEVPTMPVSVNRACELYQIM